MTTQSESGLTREQLDMAARAARLAAEEKRVTGLVMAKVEELAAWLLTLRNAQRAAADARDEHFRGLGIEPPLDNRGLGELGNYGDRPPLVRSVYDALLFWANQPGRFVGRADPVRTGPCALLYLPPNVLSDLPTLSDPVVVDGDEEEQLPNGGAMRLHERLAASLAAVPEGERDAARIRFRTSCAFLAEATAGRAPLELDARHSISLQEILYALGLKLDDNP